MKELEKRINDIVEGKLEVLCRNYDYQASLHSQLSNIDEISKLIYGPTFQRLLALVNQKLQRQELFSEKTIRVYDESWQDRVQSADKTIEFPLLKNQPDDFYTFAPPTDGSKLSKEEEQDFNEVFMKLIDVPDSFVEQIKERIIQELLLYKATLESIIGSQSHSYARLGTTGINVGVSTMQDSLADQKRVAKIREKLEPIRGNVDTVGFNVLVSDFYYYIENDKFPTGDKFVNVFDCDNIKRFGWTLNRAFYHFNKGIPVNLLVYVKNNISIFQDVPFDLKKPRKSRLYKYLSENPDRKKKKNP